MNVVVLYNRISDNPLPDEVDVLEQVRAVSESLNELGHCVAEIPFDLNIESVKKTLQKQNPDAVFNLVESVDGKGSLLHFAPSLLETLRMPFTGCPAEAVYVTSNKLLAKKLLTAARLPTPAWFHRDIQPGGIPCDPAGKWIIKSLWEHASLGMDDSAVIDAQQAPDLESALVERRSRHGGEWFAERYIDGREFNIAVLSGDDGPEVLPPAEIRFNGFDSCKPRIVDYRAKWDPDSFEYRNTIRSFSFPDIDADLLAELKHTTLLCWRLFSLRGYARVDFRVDAAGVPWILEINANPCLSQDAGFAAAVQAAGYTYTGAIRRILSDIRIHNRETPAERVASS